MSFRKRSTASRPVIAPLGLLFALLTLALGTARATGLTAELISVAAVPQYAANDASFLPSVSATGRFVAFASSASNLVAGDDNLDDDVFISDRDSDVDGVLDEPGTVSTERVSVATSGVEGNTFSDAPSVSSDGRYVAFYSYADNLVANDTNGWADVFVRDRQLGTTERVSLTTLGTEPNGDSLYPIISTDGRYVTFESDADDLVPNDTNNSVDVFIRDRQTNTTERVSVATGGAEGDDVSDFSGVSADGRYVAFESEATNLVADDTNGYSDIFVRDRIAGVTKRVSVDAGGLDADYESFSPVISADGKYVAFQSLAGNLIAGDTNDLEDIYVRNIVTDVTERVTVDSNEAEVYDYSDQPSISADGRYVAFFSFSGDLASDSNPLGDIFVRDRQSGTTEIVSVATNNAASNKSCFVPSISGDGLQVAFQTQASTLVTGDTNNDTDIFVRNRQAGTTGLVSTPDDPLQGDGASGFSYPSSDGRYVVFQSEARNLVTGDTNGRFDVFLRDRQNGITVRVSVDSTGAQANDDSYSPSLSADGRYVVYSSFANNLVTGDTNNTSDIFRWDRQSGTTLRVSLGPASIETDDESDLASVSADGRYVAFVSTATNLVAGDTNGVADIFVRDVQGGATTRQSVDAVGAEANEISTTPRISANGQYVVFSSYATNLVMGDTNTVSDIFVRDRQAGTIQRVSVAAGGAEASADSALPDISADGRFVVYASEADDLVAGDTNFSPDIFLWDRVGGLTDRVSVATGGAEADSFSLYPGVSSDGRYVVFGSLASNLVAGDTNFVPDVFVRDRQADTTVRVSETTSGAELFTGAFIASLSADGKYVALDTFGSVLPTDSNGVQDVYLVTNPISNQAPQPVADSYSVQDGQTLTITAPGVLGNDLDPEGDTLSAIVGTLPAHGMLVLQSTGAFTYTPTVGYAGGDSFTYQASDGSNTTADVTVTLTVTNAPPTISNVADQNIARNTATSALAVTLSDLETAAGSLTLSGTSGNQTLLPNANITVGGSGANRTVTLTPAAGQFGTALVTLTVSDGLATATDTLTLTVYVTAPVLTNFQVIGLTPTGATVTWTTDQAASSTVQYGLTSSVTSTVTGTAGTSHSVTLSGLTAGINYYYRVRSITTGGSAPSAESTSAILRFQTAPNVSGQGMGYAMTRDTGANLIYVNVTVFNNTATTQQSVSLTRGSLQVGSTLTGTTSTLPVSLGTIPPGGSASTRLAFPSSIGGSGVAAVLSVGWSSSTGSSSGSYRVTLP